MKTLAQIHPSVERHTQEQNITLLSALSDLPLRIHGAYVPLCAVWTLLPVPWTFKYKILHEASSIQLFVSETSPKRKNNKKTVFFPFYFFNLLSKYEGGRSGVIDYCLPCKSLLL